MAYVQSVRIPNRVPQRVVRIRVANPNYGLGILPVLAAEAVPSVSKILGKIATGLLSVVDPGKKRDANREARAEMWFQYASAGSITAARRLYGGQTIQFTDKEKQYYRDRWAKFQPTHTDLAAQAVSLGALGIPEPGSSVEPPSLSPADQQAIQDEINAYHAAHATAGVTPPAQPSLNVKQAGIGGLGLDSPVVLAVALGAAIYFQMSKRR